MGLKDQKNIALVISSLNAGGAEKVMAEIGNSAINEVGVELILLSKSELFYFLDKRIKVIEPPFTIEQMPRVIYIIRNYWWLRSSLRNSRAKTVLSFSGKYNAFVVLASLGLKKKLFVSDRSRPGISYGIFLDFLNSKIYKLVTGIIAQTEEAKRFAFRTTQHKNIVVISNPVSLPTNIDLAKKNLLILNVGRFITSKHQDWLIKYFEKVFNATWKLVFLGDGWRRQDIIKKAANSPITNQIEFMGNVKEISNWYRDSAIFAFTSTSEGFPNSLAEAMAHGCACISYDCIAGPSDIIDDGVNGFLIPEGEHLLYQQRLSQLMEDEALRIRLGKAAMEKMKQFESSKITKLFLDFINDDNRITK